MEADNNNKNTKVTKNKKEKTETERTLLHLNFSLTKDSNAYHVREHACHVYKEQINDTLEK